MEFGAQCVSTKMLLSTNPSHSLLEPQGSRCYLEKGHLSCPYHQRHKPNRALLITSPCPGSPSHAYPTLLEDSFKYSRHLYLSLLYTLPTWPGWLAGPIPTRAMTYEGPLDAKDSLNYVYFSH
jgi:hypothetical protein